jgi:hypothetical protein
MERTTENAYPAMFPVNSAHARAPLWFGGDISLWYIGTIVLGASRIKFGMPNLAEAEGTYDSSPTPRPLMIRPRTRIVNEGVNACVAPPIVNTSAPMNSVPLRPIMSPTRPAAREVTIEVEYESCTAEVIEL